MKNTVFLPLVLSIVLLSSSQKAKAAIPASDIIGGIEVATHLTITAKPFIRMAYKAVKNR